MPRPKREVDSGLSWDEIPEERLTQFARRIRAYVRDQWPMTLAKLARNTGSRISSQTMLDWFRKGSIPQPGTIRILAEATGLPYEELLRLAEHDDRDLRLSRRDQPKGALLFDRLEAALLAEEEWSEHGRQHQLELLREYRARMLDEDGASRLRVVEGRTPC